MTRRTLIAALAGAAAAKPTSLRLAICNETFHQWTFADGCRGAARTGYTGLEIAPFTLAETKPAEARRMIADAGLQYVGLHNLLTAPTGLHATTSDSAVRARTWDRLHRLVDLSAELGPASVMVFGSGKQRSASPGESPADATRRLEDGLAALAPPARQAGVTILLEPLAPHLANVVNSLAEAVAIVDRIGSPALRTMFDSHNAVKETLPHGDLIRKYFPYIRHVHVNEMDGRHPGAGNYDFKPVLRALIEKNYQGWVSLEVFDFSAGPEKIASDSAKFLRREEAAARY